MKSTTKRIWETRRETASDEDRMVERLTLRAATRIARKQVDPETAAALRRLWAA